MHQELIGQEASLSLPCSVDAIALLLKFIEELMEVGGAEAHRPDKLERELRDAITEICRRHSLDGVVATLVIHDRGFDVRLRSGAQTADAGDDERVVSVREA